MRVVQVRAGTRRTKRVMTYLISVLPRAETFILHTNDKELPVWPQTLFSLLDEDKGGPAFTAPFMHPPPSLLAEPQRLA